MVQKKIVFLTITTEMLICKKTRWCKVEMMIKLYSALHECFQVIRKFSGTSWQ